MKKYGWKALVLLALAALVFVWLIRAPILSSYLTKKMGLEVSLRWIGLWPSHTTIHLFKVKNPPGYTGEAFKAAKIVCNYQLGPLFGDPSVIEEIEIHNCVLRIDFPSSLSASNNWTAIGEKIRKERGGGVIIRKLILTNFDVEIHGSPVFVKAKQTHFDRLEFDEIDSEEGFPTEKLIQLIFQTSGIDQFLQNLFQPAQKYLSPLKIFGT